MIRNKDMARKARCCSSAEERKMWAAMKESCCRRLCARIPREMPEELSASSDPKRGAFYKPEPYCTASNQYRSKSSTLLSQK